MLNESGYFLSRQAGCFVVKKISTRKEVEKYPILEGTLGEIQLASGNLVSTGALVSASFNHIPVIVKTALGSPVGVFVSIDDMSHVDTRCFQYEVMKQLKALDIVKEILLAKIKGCSEVLKKYGLRRIDYSVIEQVNDTHLWLLKDEELKKYRDYGVFPLDALDKLRIKYLSIEGRMARNYVGQIFSMFPESLRPSSRRARARYCRDLAPKDFELKGDTLASRRGKRIFLNKHRNKDFLVKLEEYFQNYVPIHRVRMGRKQRLNSLICEEALQLARFLRCERPSWHPRMVELS